MLFYGKVFGLDHTPKAVVGPPGPGGVGRVSNPSDFQVQQAGREEA